MGINPLHTCIRSALQLIWQYLYTLIDLVPQDLSYLKKDSGLQKMFSILQEERLKSMCIHWPIILSNVQNMYSTYYIVFHFSHVQKLLYRHMNIPDLLFPFTDVVPLKVEYILSAFENLSKSLPPVDWSPILACFMRNGWSIKCILCMYCT